MVDLTRLADQARLRAERGRLRAASRILAIVLPLGLLAALAGVSAAPCVLGTAVLAASAVGLRWWHADGWTGTTLGLRLGVVPYAVGLTATCLGQPSSPGWGLACVAACLVASAGVVVATGRAASARRGQRVVVSGLLVSGGAGVLGCAEVLARFL